MKNIIYAISVFIMGYLFMFFTTMVTGLIAPGLSIDFAINAILILCSVITYFSLKILEELKKHRK